jgi:hypothetical protein
MNIVRAYLGHAVYCLLPISYLRKVSQPVLSI